VSIVAPTMALTRELGDMRCIGWVDNAEGAELMGVLAPRVGESSPGMAQIPFDAPRPYDAVTVVPLPAETLFSLHTGSGDVAAPDDAGGAGGVGELDSMPAL